MRNLVRQTVWVGAFITLVMMAPTQNLSLAQERSAGPVTAKMIEAGLPKDGSEWVTFGGGYDNQRHSPLTQITPSNVARLAPQWTFQTNVADTGLETTALFHDNILYITGSSNYAWAVDARSGRELWKYKRDLPPSGSLTVCCGLKNRGFAMLGNLLFMATLDAHLVALDKNTGVPVWDVPMEDYRVGYSATIAPMVVNDTVIVGMAGADLGVRCFIDAYDAATGKRKWRFYTVPGPGETGNETWAGDSWKRGGGSVWATGAYDPQLGLLYYGIGNPGPDYYGADRAGDNLYTASIVALEVETGKMRWHYQFTPHDVHDWDSAQVPILTELTIKGRSHKVVMQANRNGFFYTLDRVTGELLVSKPFVNTTWAKEIGPDGRPVYLPDYQPPSEQGAFGCPDLGGGTNFHPASFDARLNLFFVTARESCAIFYAWKPDFAAGERYTGGASSAANTAKPIGALRAIDPTTGEMRWEITYPNVSFAGVLSTASGLVFTGDGDGNLLAMDSKKGKLLWHYQMGAPLHGTSPITYMLDGRQHVLVPSGMTVTAWALPEVPRQPAQQ